MPTQPTPKFSEIVKNLPSDPGVYRFYAMDKTLLYIGKAKNLKNRVSSYFQDGRPKNQRLSLMISQIDDIQYTVVKSEKESLILEANLIHKLQPKYNILLKDDRSYLYVRITNDVIPTIFLTRKKFDPKSEYFGPYTKKYGIEQTLRTVRTIFPYCQTRFPQKRACSYVGIHQCDGICIGLEDKEKYKNKLEQIKKVLKGQINEVEDFIENEITNAIKINNFQLAALWRDRLRILKETIVDQKIILPHPQDLDIITLIVEQNSDGLAIGSVFVQNIRSGKIVNVNNFLLSGTEESENQIFNFTERFLSSYYYNQTDKVDILLQTGLTKKED
jgi:excinuclease ABC subunit C